MFFQINDLKTARDGEHEQKIETTDVWFFNFGPSEFVSYVSFTNGIVERIQMGGYGE